MDSKKEQIIQIALKRFSHYGFNKTTMSEIALDLNITKANLYYYYPDKNVLIKDVLVHVSNCIGSQQLDIVKLYDYNLLEIIDQLLELRAHYLREYYVLHISESLEWIKGEGIRDVLENMHFKDVDMMKYLFDLAVKSGEIMLEDVEKASTIFLEIIRGLGLIRSVTDVLTGMPTPDKVDDILCSQKEAVKFIFANKLNN